jgi:septation ring formation regulator EzrA
MKHQRHFERASDVAIREAAQISTMISDLDRLVRLLDCDVTTEEERARISDRSEPAYPILAITLAARRDNLRDTIAALEQRLTTIKAPLVEQVAA